jgi:acyl carrier protein
MTREEIQPKVIDLAAEQAGVEKSEITPATHFVNDLHFDSLDVVEFAMEVEDELKVSISDNEIEKLQTVGDVIDYVHAHLVDPAAAAAAAAGEH